MVQTVVAMAVVRRQEKAAAGAGEVATMEAAAVKAEQQISAGEVAEVVRAMLRVLRLP